MPPFRFFSQRRLGSLVALISLGFSIWALWYGVNSDRDDVAPLLRQLIPAGHCACRTSTVFNCGGCLDANVRVVDGAGPQWEFQYHVNGNARTLSQARCSAAFPGLCEDLWHSKEFWKGRISTADLDSFPLVDGTTRALIYNGELYAVATKSKAEDHRRKAVAILSSIHRALVSAPDRAAIRNMEFIFSIEDKAEDINANGHPVWTLARKATEHSLWLMPDFGFWAWDNIIGDAENAIGSYDEIVHNVETLEANLPFEHKKRQLAWRGKLSFAPKLRRALLDQSRVHEWGDVKEVEWQQRTNYLSLEDHCKYQFIAHAEGRSYSASLKYRQACHSVPVIHKLQYIQHHHYLLVREGPHQNYVGVERDFSDLPAKMTHLLENPALARTIADNNVATFRERYLTPAAEACYWRALFDAYANVSGGAELWRHSGGGRVKRGLRYESFVLLSSDEMLDFEA